jgi:carboxyl-terminal processing protease
MMTLKMNRFQIAGLALGVALACSDSQGASLEPPDGSSHAEDPSASPVTIPVAAAAAALNAATPRPTPNTNGAPATMPDAERAFARVVELISTNYMDAAVDRDALYTGAVEGMLARLYQAKDTAVNTLISPRELREIQRSNAGSIAGVGLVIEAQGDLFVIKRILRHSPAARSRLQPGDRILGVGAARVNGRPLAEVLDQIRGEPGTRVDLFVQRDTDEWHETLERATVTFRNVEGRLVAPGVGLLRLLSFGETTTEQLDRELEALEAAGQKALIIDLRYCPGGLLEVAEVTVERFLQRGQNVVTLVDRDGRKRVRTAAADGRWRDGPLAVLMGPKTASSAELFAEALVVHRGALTIGQPTLAKNSAEVIHELGNGWALKLSESRLIGARGDGVTPGLEPMLPVPLSDSATPPPLDESSGEDKAVRVATEWLRSRF